MNLGSLQHSRQMLLHRAIPILVCVRMCVWGGFECFRVWGYKGRCICSCLSSMRSPWILFLRKFTFVTALFFSDRVSPWDQLTDLAKLADQGVPGSSCLTSPMRAGLELLILLLQSTEC